jgi:phospholipid/cholesterol/gamma-HCH transport system substrate-binding protein
MSSWLESRTTKRVALVVAVAAVGLLLVGLFRGSAQKTAVVYFPTAIHLYAGSEVDVLDVKVGSVRSVEPQGDRVRVVLAYDASRRIPADARVVVDEPTLVADRVVELTPPYDGGPVLRDGAVIPLARTQVPVELDTLESNLVRLAQALGPNGANRRGALARALEVAAANLRAQGTPLHATISGFSSVMGTLGSHRDALVGAVRNLQQFTALLAQHDAQTRAFTTDLADVSAQLSGDRTAFTAALRDLGTALGDVATFLRHNRSKIASDVDGLARVTNILARERTLLAHIVDMGAVGISNYPHMYTPSARTYNARFDNAITDNPALFVCQLYASVGGSPDQCLRNLAPLKQVALR